MSGGLISFLSKQHIVIIITLATLATVSQRTETHEQQVGYLAHPAPVSEFFDW